MIGFSRSDNAGPWKIIALSMFFLAASIGLFWLSTDYPKDSVLGYILANIGLVFAPLSIIIIIDRLFFVDTMRKSIDELFAERFHAHTGIMQYGFRNVHYPLELAEILNLVAPGDTVCILDTYIPQLDEKFLKSLERAVWSGVNVKVLFSRPGSEFSNMRAVELGGNYEPESFNPGIIQCARRLLQCGENRSEIQPKGCVEIKFYGTFASLPIYLIERAGKIERAYFSFFLRDATRFDAHVEITREKDAKEQGSLIERFEDYFNYKWAEVDHTRVTSEVTLNEFLADQTPSQGE